MNKEYLVIAEPGSVVYHAPSQLRTKKEAFEVAKKLAEQERKNFCIVKIVGRAKIVKAVLEDYEYEPGQENDSE